MYMWWVMRPLGGAVSSDPEAYKYLVNNAAIPVVFAAAEDIKSAGYSKVDAKPLSLGMATRFLLTK